MKYTPSQDKAIKTTGENILVSASAGSGKTGVLKERVIERIKSGVDIDKLIILTFTKAAAEEMKSRILKELDKLGLEEQIAKADNAIISTFDAFSLRLVSEYHYLLDLDKDIEISDSVLIKIKKQDLINDVVKQFFIDGSLEFRDFFKLYFQKSDNWLYQAIYNIGESLRKLPDYQEKIRNYHYYYLSDEFILSNANVYLEKIKDEMDKQFQAFQEEYLKNYYFEDEKIIEYLSQVSNEINKILNQDSANDFIKAINNHSFPRKPAIKEFEKPEIIDHIKSICNDFKKMNVLSIDTLVSSIKSTIPSVEMLLKMTKTYLDEYSLFQKQDNLYSFEDIMFFSIDLLENFPEIRLKYQNEINEILIDEYQDTNDLQDYFISLISNNNVFMVGDVKQSIYRFRDANPKNFLRIFDNYQAGLGGKAIFLQENFRSNKYVLAEINNIFRKVMHKDLGGIDYIDEQVLISGYNDNHLLHNPDCFKIISYDTEEILERYPKLTKAEIEAHYLAQDILKRVNNKETIYDLKNQCFKSLDYKDITILVDRKTEFSSYGKVISRYNIPIEIYSDEPFFLSDEIQFITQFLILLNCFKDQEYFSKHFKTAFYACARSFVYQVKDETIIDFLVLEDVKTYEDLGVLTKYPSLNQIYNDLVSLIDKIEILPPFEIIESIYQELNIYKKIAYLDNPGKKEEKLDFFLLKVKSFKSFLFIDLIRYLENINDLRDLDIEYSETKKSTNAIKLMSIHKSKGLQFPVVYAIGLAKQFNNTENKENFLFDKNKGILTKAYDDGFYRNFLQDLLFKEIEQENLSEKIRLLYVALTRTINNLCLVVEYDESLIEKKPKKFLSFKHLLYQVYDFSEIEKDTLIIPEALTSCDKIPKTEKTIKYKQFTFSKTEKIKKRYSKSMNSFLEDDIIKMIDYGNYYHQLIEKVNFNDFDNSIMHYPIELQDSLKKLVNSPLFKTFKNPEFFQEYEFYQEKDNQVKRGIIDLMVIDDDRVSVIDFKLRNIDDEAYQNQLFGYYDFLKDKVNKPIDLYLYSIMNKNLKKFEL